MGDNEEFMRKETEIGLILSIYQMVYGFIGNNCTNNLYY